MNPDVFARSYADAPRKQCSCVMAFIDRLVFDLHRRGYTCEVTHHGERIAFHIKLGTTQMNVWIEPNSTRDTIAKSVSETMVKLAQVQAEELTKCMEWL